MMYQAGLQTLMTTWLGSEESSIDTLLLKHSFFYICTKTSASDGPSLLSPILQGSWHSLHLLWRHQARGHLQKVVTTWHQPPRVSGLEHQQKPFQFFLNASLPVLYSNQFLIFYRLLKLISGAGCRSRSSESSYYKFYLNQHAAILPGYFHWQMFLATNISVFFWWGILTLQFVLHQVWHYA